MDSHLNQIVKSCDNCISTRNLPTKLKEATWPIPTEPWSRLHVDFAGPVYGKMLLILVDATAKWPEVVPLNTATTETTIRALCSTFTGRGLPLQLVSDNEPQFTSKVFEIKWHPPPDGRTISSRDQQTGGTPRTDSKKKV